MMDAKGDDRSAIERAARYAKNSRLSGLFVEKTPMRLVGAQPVKRLIACLSAPRRWMRQLEHPD
jgi:hypothetical protein